MSRTGPIGAALALALAPLAAAAQTPDVAGLLGGVDLRGQGWSPLGQRDEMIKFGLALVEAAVLTAAITFHPVLVGARRTRADFELPRALFIFALIGMTIGFLVMHHGYLIGFVVFGIGGLLRFRSDFGEPAHTTPLILVTLIGLAVGLDLPVMALVTTITAWLILQFLGDGAHVTLEVKFDEKKASRSAADELRRHLAERGFQTASVSKSKFKPTAEFVLSGVDGARRDALAREMLQLQSEKTCSVSDWHLD